MRKTSLILLGAAAGAAMTLLAVQPRIMLVGATAKAAAADTYRQLNLFGDVFERVRADYVEKPDDAKLIEQLYLWTLVRPPEQRELEVALEFLKARAEKRDEAAQDLLWALLNTRDFLLVH